jgi:hypothetical protein
LRSGPSVASLDDDHTAARSQLEDDTTKVLCKSRKNTTLQPGGTFPQRLAVSLEIAWSIVRARSPRVPI